MEETKKLKVLTRTREKKLDLKRRDQNSSYSLRKGKKS